jgi:RHS repeat-associated protein
MNVYPDGSTVRYDWCSCGSMSKLTDQLNQVTEWKRDILGRVTEKIRHGEAVKSTTFTYEAKSGRLSSIRRPNDHATTPPTISYRYYIDGKLRLEDYSDAGTPDVTYHYTTAVNGATQDVLGRLRFVQEAGATSHTYTYTALVTGLPTSTTANGAGSLDIIDGPFGNDDLNHNYDWQGRNNDLDLQTDDAATISRSETRTWDKMGRPATVVNTLGTFTFGYSNLLNRPATLTAPTAVGLVTNYSYYADNATGNKARRLQSITHSRSGTQYASHAYQYDAAGRITRWDRSIDGGAVQQWQYGYNLDDELTEVNGPDSENPAHRQRWAYDQGGNWLSHGQPGSMSARSHDGQNRLQHIGGAGSTTVEGHINEFAAVTVQTQGQAAKKAILTSDPASGGYRFRAEVAVAEGSNEITVSATDLDNETTTEQMTFNAAPVTREFEYDANGNMTADKSGGVVQRSFTWDGKNRLKSVTVGSNTWSWEYDYLDRRRKERLNGTEVKRFVWADTDIVQERSSTNAITRTHYFGGFVVISGTKKYLTTSDHLGHTREVIAANAAAGTVGSVQARYDYNAYQGPNKVSGTTVDATFLTIGRYYHHEGSGLELALYRAYDPELGRWMGEDPIEERGGINLFGFVGNGPVAGVDLNGLLCVGPHPLIAAPSFGYGVGTALSLATLQPLLNALTRPRPLPPICTDRRKPVEDCRTATRKDLKDAGITDEHAFKRLALGDGAKISLFDICACKDSSGKYSIIKIKLHGKCGKYSEVDFQP